MKYVLKNGETVEFYNRKNPRLKDYDYSQDGTYFITFCIKDRKNIFGRINKEQDLENAETSLNLFGNIAKKHIEEIQKRFDSINVDTYVIMPNHIHLLISVINKNENTKQHLSETIGALKSLITIECRKNGSNMSFQSSYFEHIIRNQKDYDKHFDYIIHNPGTWINDKLYSE